LDSKVIRNCSDWREKGEAFYSDNKCLLKFYPRSSAKAPMAAAECMHSYLQILEDSDSYKKQAAPGVNSMSLLEEKQMPGSF
jgi:hypothetical protein